MAVNYCEHQLAHSFDLATLAYLRKKMQPVILVYADVACVKMVGQFGASGCGLLCEIWVVLAEWEEVY